MVFQKPQWHTITTFFAETPAALTLHIGLEFSTFKDHHQAMLFSTFRKRLDGGVTCLHGKLSKFSSQLMFGKIPKGQSRFSTVILDAPRLVVVGIGVGGRHDIYIVFERLGIVLMNSFVDICDCSCCRFVGVVLGEGVVVNVGGSFLTGCNFLVLATTKENLVPTSTKLFPVSLSMSGVNVATFHPWL